MRSAMGIANKIGTMCGIPGLVGVVTDGAVRQQPAEFETVKPRASTGEARGRCKRLR